MANKVIKFKDKYITNFVGYNKLVAFYREAKQYQNQIISLDFYQMRWFDGNLSAILAAMMYKLNIENNLRFSTDMEFIRFKFDFLMRNQFIPTNDIIEDKQKSTLPLNKFQSNDKRSVDYVEQIFEHRGLPIIGDDVKAQVKDDLIEILCNIDYHAKTTYPYFICGQYYPTVGYFTLTITDLGIGFLEPIKNFTKGKINTSADAISWALQGHSTKTDGTPGGLGIKRIYKYCKENKGIFQIITGSSYWGSDYEHSVLRGFAKVEYPFCGTTINLFFSWN
jgi:hypothetical protein